LHSSSGRLYCLVAATLSGQTRVFTKPRRAANWRSSSSNFVEKLGKNSNIGNSIQEACKRALLGIVSCTVFCIQWAKDHSKWARRRQCTSIASVWWEQFPGINAENRRAGLHTVVSLPRLWAQKCSALAQSLRPESQPRIETRDCLEKLAR